MRALELVKNNKLLSVVALMYAVLFITIPDKAILSVQNSMFYVKEMLQIMPVIFILTAIIEAWVPRETIINGFGEKAGVKGNVYSFLLGSFSAGPIYAAFPISKMLLKKGASITNIVIILSSWAVIKVPMLANEAKFLGPKFMGLRWVLTVVSILAMGYMVSLVVNKNSIPDITQESQEQSTPVYIKKQLCIGCGICAKLAPSQFVIRNKKAEWIATYKPNDDITNNELLMAAQKCPAKVISLASKEPA